MYGAWYCSAKKYWLIYFLDGENEDKEEEKGGRSRSGSERDGSDKEESDREKSDKEESDKEKSDKEGSYQEDGSDREGSTKAESGKEGNFFHFLYLHYCHVVGRSIYGHICSTISMASIIGFYKSFLQNLIKWN